MLVSSLDELCDALFLAICSISSLCTVEQFETYQRRRRQIVANMFLLECALFCLMLKFDSARGAFTFNTSCVWVDFLDTLLWHRLWHRLYSLESCYSVANLDPILFSNSLGSGCIYFIPFKKGLKYKLSKGLYLNYNGWYQRLHTI